MSRFKTIAVLLAYTSILRAADVAGHYQLRGVMEVGSELLLKPNGTFEYMLAYGAADYLAKGTWKVQGENVLLTTSGTTAAPFRLLTSALTNEPGIRVFLKAPNGGAVPNIDVALRTAKGMETARTDSDGVASFQPMAKPDAVLFRIRVYRLEAGPYDVDPAHNDFTFEINAEAITQVNFKSEPLKINGGSLEMRFWDKSKAMLYRKQ